MNYGQMIVFFFYVSSTLFVVILLTNIKKKKSIFTTLFSIVYVLCVIKFDHTLCGTWYYYVNMKPEFSCNILVRICSIFFEN